MIFARRFQLIARETKQKSENISYNPFLHINPIRICANTFGRHLDACSGHDNTSCTLPRPPPPFFITFERHVQKSKTKVKGKRNSKTGSKSLSAICANNKNDSTKCPVYAPSPSPLHSTLCPWEALTGMCVCSLCHMAIISAWPARTANELNQKSICRRDKSGGGGR